MFSTLVGNLLACVAVIWTPAWEIEEMIFCRSLALIQTALESARILDCRFQMQYFLFSLSHAGKKNLWKILALSGPTFFPAIFHNCQRFLASEKTYFSQYIHNVLSHLCTPHPRCHASHFGAWFDFAVVLKIGAEKTNQLIRPIGDWLINW